jgi:hypothetical protein
MDALDLFIILLFCANCNSSINTRQMDEIKNYKCETTKDINIGE